MKPSGLMMRRLTRHERCLHGRRLLDAIKASGCVVCRETELAVLDFHHREGEEKRFTLSGSAACKPPAELDEELRKVVVVCSNCHRKVHAGLVVLDEEGYPRDPD